MPAAAACEMPPSEAQRVRVKKLLEERKRLQESSYGAQELIDEPALFAAHFEQSRRRVRGLFEAAHGTLEAAQHRRIQELLCELEKVDARRTRIQEDLIQELSDAGALAVGARGETHPPYGALLTMETARKIRDRSMVAFVVHPQDYVGIFEQHLRKIHIHSAFQS